MNKGLARLLAQPGMASLDVLDRFFDDHDDNDDDDHDDNDDDDHDDDPNTQQWLHPTDAGGPKGRGGQREAACGQHVPHRDPGCQECDAFIIVVMMNKIVMI